MMEPTKRASENNLLDTDKKRKKVIVDSHSILRNSFTRLEDLSNELFYELFDYLDISHVHQAFLHLTTRFDNLLTDPTLPIRISLSFVSKSTFSYYYQQIIIPYQHRITLLHLSNPLIINRLFSPLLQLTRLENLRLCNIESTFLEQIQNYLTSLPCLSSLVMHCTDEIPHTHLFYQHIFRLSALKYCKLSFEGDAHWNPLPMATTDFSPIEYLIIMNTLDVDELQALLSYLPHLRRLSIHDLSKSRKKQIEFHPVVLNDLTHVSLSMTDVSFDHFESMIKTLFHPIQVLYISTEDDLEYINASRWERLILSHLPHLRIFDIQYEHSFDDTNYRLDNDLLNQFHSSFWFQRKWFFEHQIYDEQNEYIIIFYSINPYRREQYLLYGEKNDNIYQNNHINSVDHLKIQTRKALMTCKSYFPNVTKMTLSNQFIYQIKHSFSNQLNKILPLKQLTKLVINLTLSCFSKIIELLPSTPYLRTLNIEVLSWNDPQIAYHLTNLYVLQQSQTFRSIAKTNQIENLIISPWDKIEAAQFLVNLCPRVQHLTMSTCPWQFKQLLSFLLSKMTDKSGHLVSLCIEDVCKSDLEVVKKLIESQEELHIDLAKVIQGFHNDMLTRYSIYLWWWY